MAFFLVTGGAGFIGSNLVEALVASGDKVRVLDNFSTGKRDNIEAWRSKIEVIEGSVTNFEDVKRAVSGVDYVLHQGALPSVPKSIELPRESNDANISGTVNVLTAARDAKVKRVVYAASSSAYGETPTLPKVETMPAIPLSPYAIQKYAGELYCRIYTECYGLETVALRYFNIFGPRQDPTSFYSAVIPKFITVMMQDEAPTIFGDGETSRDFTFIANVVDANLRACTAPKKAAGRVMNIACAERVTLNDLARVIKETLGRGKAAIHAPDRPGDIKHSLADISLAKELIGYEPKVLFAEGIKRTVDWYKAHG